MKTVSGMHPVRSDDYRIEFITEHLQWIFKSIEDGAKCLGYHYWGVIDNWILE